MELYRSKGIPLPPELRLFLARQVDRHLTKAEVHAPPGALPLLRVLHVDTCLTCAYHRGQATQTAATVKAG